MLQENEVSGYDCVDTEELLNGFYDELYHAPIEENKILFKNQSGEGYGGNPKYIAEKLIEYDTDQKLEDTYNRADKIMYTNKKEKKERQKFER